MYNRHPSLPSPPLPTLPLSLPSLSPSLPTLPLSLTLPLSPPSLSPTRPLPTLSPHSPSVPSPPSLPIIPSPPFPPSNKFIVLSSLSKALVSAKQCWLQNGNKTIQANVCLTLYYLLIKVCSYTAQSVVIVKALHISSPTVNWGDVEGTKMAKIRKGSKGNLNPGWLPRPRVRHSTAELPGSHDRESGIQLLSSRAPTTESPAFNC